VLRRACAAAALGAWFFIAPAQAAWLQTKGEGLIISSLSSYHSDARFDSFGLRSDGRGYDKQELSVYGVYGLTEKLTLGAQPSFFRLRATNANRVGHEGMRGLSQVELFVRTSLVAADYWILSGQALLKLPGPRAVDREPLLENASRDAEVRLLLGRSGRLARRFLNLEYFSSIEAAYRARYRRSADQWRADAAFGVRPLQNYQIIVQSFNILSSRSPDDSDPTAYDLFKAQVSVVRDLPYGMAVQAGGYSEYAGRNIGAGKALFMAVWYRF
jgi:protein XagA